MKQHKKLLLSFCTVILGLVLSHSVSAAEYIYISDNLRVGVRQQPASGTPPISVVFTGMRLKVEERTGGYIKVTTSKGITGWIKDIYATKKAPAVIQLNDLRIKFDKLKKDRNKDIKVFTTLEQANKTLNTQVSELKAERREWESERITFMASQHKKSSWYWIVGIVALILICFTAGAIWYRTQAMKRLGGLRV